jgi:hypothetical protein
MSPRILKMTLHKVWFAEIAAGKKLEEYREIKPYWTKRLAKEYDAIEFKNGYRSNCPVMIVEYFGFEVKKILHPISNKPETVFALKLGKVIEINNYEVQQKDSGQDRNSVGVRRLHTEGDM